MDKNVLKFIVDYSLDYYTICKNDFKDIFEFEQKFLSDVKDACVDKFKKHAKIKMRNHITLLKFQDKINNEFLFDNDYYYALQLGKFLMFHIIFYVINEEKYTYQVTEIKIDSKGSPFVLTPEQVVLTIN